MRERENLDDAAQHRTYLAEHESHRVLQELLDLLRTADERDRLYHVKLWRYEQMVVSTFAEIFRRTEITMAVEKNPYPIHAYDGARTTSFGDGMVNMETRPILLTIAGRSHELVLDIIGLPKY